MAKRDKSLADVEAELARIKQNLEAKRAKLAAMEKERNAVLGRLIWTEIERDPQTALARQVHELIHTLTLKKERALFDLPSAGKTGSNDNTGDPEGDKTPDSAGETSNSEGVTQAFMNTDHTG